jgi:hypothetical protein
LPDDFESWRSELLAGLKGVFRDVLRSPFFTRQADHATWPKVVEHSSPSVLLETENGIVITVTQVAGADTPQPAKVWMVVTNEHDQPSLPSWFAAHRGADDVVYVCQVRGVGPSQWTQNNPPNYVERSHVLLGQTVDGGRVADVLAATSWIRAKHGDAELCLAGDGGAGILAAYAAVLSRQDTTQADDVFTRLVLHRPPLSHMSASAPAVLNILRVCDIPDVLGALAPLPLTILSSDDSEELKRVRAIYDAAGKADVLVVEKVDGE